MLAGLTMKGETGADCQPRTITGTLGVRKDHGDERGARPWFDEPRCLVEAGVIDVDKRRPTLVRWP